jgi:serine/threonine-protein kinase
VLRRVQHPHIAHVLDLGLVDGRLAIVREDKGRFSLGLVLQRLNTREVVLPSALALTFALELLEVVAAAHGAGVIHGALTPGNVVVGDDGQPSVTDFGALQALQASAVLRSTFASRGRTSYRAPELKTSATEATAQTDLYAVGAMIYELLTLREASLGNNAVSTRSERLPPPSRLVRRLHARIDPVIMRALEQTPARRQKSAHEFADGIRDFLSSQGGVPPREDLKKFVGELFPNEVQMNTMGPVPFEHEFALEPLEQLGAVSVAPSVVRERPPFSGGGVDATTPTSDGLPVFRDEATQTDRPAVSSSEDFDAVAVTSPSHAALRPVEPLAKAGASLRALSPVADGPLPTWDAPRGAMPDQRVDANSEANPEVMKKRVRSLEDFHVDKNAPGPKPSAPKSVAVKKTTVTFAQNFPLEDGGGRADIEAFHRRARQRARVVSLIATLTLLGTVSGLSYLWWVSHPDPVATLITYLPRPIQAALPRHRAPPEGTLKAGQSVKLPDFDAMMSGDGGVREPKPAPVPVVVKPPPSVDADCYVTPKGHTGALAVVTDAKVRVEVDGRRVCGDIERVGVLAGAHVVRVVDVASKREYVNTAHVEAGRVFKLVPTFR